MNKTNNLEYSNISTKYDISCIIVLCMVVVGVAGNLLTIFALPFAKLRKRHDFHKSWSSNYIFIWHLALIDLVGSINMASIYIHFVFDPIAINKPEACIAQVSIRDFLVLVESGAIASIAIVKMLGITKRISWLNFCDDNKRVMLLLVCPWAYGSVFYARKFFLIGDLLNKQKLKGDKFDCGTFFFEVNTSEFTLYCEFVAHNIVLLLIILCYITVIIYIKKISKRVSGKRTQSSQEEDSKLSKTTKIIFGVCGVYVIQCIPYMIVRGFFVSSMRKGFFIQFSFALKIWYIIYYTQFVTNIFIYCLGKSDLYKAYKDFILKIIGCFRKKKKSQSNFCIRRFKSGTQRHSQSNNAFSSTGSNKVNNELQASNS